MRIYAIPGLGTNHAIFDRLKIKNHELVVLKWPPLKKDYSLEDYATSFIPQIKTDEPFILMGLSFGGMLVVELSKVIKPVKTILISSVKTRNDLPWWIRALKYFPVHRLFSDSLIRRVSYRSRWILGFMVEYMPDLAAMIKDMPDNYFSCAIDYIIRWKNTEKPGNCVLIHGTGDRLLWYCRESTDYIVERGSHAMIITRAGEINRLLEKILD